jgi:serine phosphatase RsbU (regulator of sigma subunit)
VDAARAVGVALSRVLDAAEDASPVQAVEAVTRELSAALNASVVSFLIADLSGRGLVRLAQIKMSEGIATLPPGQGNDWRDNDEATELVPFDGGPAEEALRTQTLQVVKGGAPEQWTVLAPVTERGESLGLLEMCVPVEPTEQVIEDITRIAHVLGFVVIANRRHTDLFEWGQRSTRFTLPAEIQRRLLPAAFTCEAGAFTLSAWLEPAANVGGDTFDYSVSPEVLHLSVTDAMGHGVASALTATLCVGSLRNTRRQGATLLEQAAAASTALADHAQSLAADAFATGLLGRLDLRTGLLQLVNAGHVLPFLARGGVVTRVDLPACLPFGIFADGVYESSDVQLQPGDRLVIVTDGMLERNAAAIDMAVEIYETRSLHPREATRRLADHVLEATGHALADDATLLVIDWHGHHGRDRATVAGADAQSAAATP